MLPSEKDIEKRKAKLDGFLKNIDKETGVSPEAAMINMVRGAIRQSWMKSPTKLAYLYSKTEPDMDDSNRRKWKVQCECCRNWFKESDVEVDHIEGNNSFTTVADFENYFQKILQVGFDGLQILCKDCHAIKSHSEKRGIPFEEAKIEKKAIAIIKAKEDRLWLSNRGIVPASNAEKRRDQLVEAIKKENIETE